MPPKKYNTEEERVKARKEWSKKYYQDKKEHLLYKANEYYALKKEKQIEEHRKVLLQQKDDREFALLEEAIMKTRRVLDICGYCPTCKHKEIEVS